MKSIQIVALCEDQKLILRIFESLRSDFRENKCIEYCTEIDENCLVDLAGFNSLK